MAHEITVPRLGWSMDEGVFGEWLKAPGEFVRAGDAVFLLEGEKAAHEVESFDSGYLCIPPDAPASGATVRVGAVIGFLLAEGEPPPTTVHRAGSAPARTPAASVPPEPSLPAASLAAAAEARAAGTRRTSPVSAPMLPRAAGPAARRLARQYGIDLNAVFTPDPTGRVRCEDIQRAALDCIGAARPEGRLVATPRARRRARELGVDWTRVTGTGRGGRIRERDVLSQQPLSTTGGAAFVSPAPIAPGRHAPATKPRLVLAQRMLAGVLQAAPVTLTTKVDAAPLAAYRSQLKTSAPDGLAPSYTDILISLTAHALRDLPALNACWHRDGIYAYDAIHIAAAVDAESGLVAPVIRHADQLTIAQIAEQTRRLIEQARSGRLNQQQLDGGTFTISNLGMFGVDAFTPILNLPQAGVLGIGRIVAEPVVRSGRLEAGWTLTLSLTFDHRVIDGAPAARWLQRLCERISSLPAEGPP